MRDGDLTRFAEESSGTSINQTEIRRKKKLIVEASSIERENDENYWRNLFLHVIYCYYRKVRIEITRDQFKESSDASVILFLNFVFGETITSRCFVGDHRNKRRRETKWPVSNCG
jgi:hypothetical protein